MQNIEQFMLEYLRENAALMEHSLEQFLPFRKKFYADDCLLGLRRAEKLKEILASTERISDISHSGSQATVITVSEDKSGPFSRTKYDLQLIENSWFIKHVELECPSCRGITGDNDCPICKGNGWHYFAKQKRIVTQSFLPPLPPLGRF